MSSDDLTHETRRSTTSHRARLVVVLVAGLAANGLAAFIPSPAAVVLHTLTGALVILVVVLLVRSRSAG